MEEKTLYDIVQKLEEVIRELSDFSESEELYIEDLCQDLSTVKNKIQKTLD